MGQPEADQGENGFGQHSLKVSGRLGREREFTPQVDSFDSKRARDRKSVV